MKKRTVSILQKVISSLTAAAVIMANRMPILAASENLVHDGITFRPWGDTEAQKTSFPTSGDWYLTEDIVITTEERNKIGYWCEPTSSSTPLNPSINNNARVKISGLNLDLNGHTVTFDLAQPNDCTHSESVAICVTYSSSKAFSIYDSGEGQTGRITTTRQSYLINTVTDEETGDVSGDWATTNPVLIYCNKDAVINLHGGTLESEGDLCVYALNRGTLSVRGGALNGNAKAYNFNLSGGEIRGGVTLGTGITDYNEPKADISGGSIASADGSAPVYIDGKAEVQIHGEASIAAQNENKYAIELGAACSGTKIYIYEAPEITGSIQFAPVDKMAPDMTTIIAHSPTNNGILYTGSETIKIMPYNTNDDEAYGFCAVQWADSDDYPDWRDKFVAGSKFYELSYEPSDTGVQVLILNHFTHSAFLYPNGGSVNGTEGDEYRLGYRETVQTDLPIPERKGHAFLGWYDNESLNGDPIEYITGEDTVDLHYWAKWERKTYTVAFELNGGEMVGSDITEYTFGDEKILPSAQKEGYTFGGWYDNEELDGASMDKISSDDTENKIFYAKWEPITYGITLHLGGVETTSDSYVYNERKELADPDEKRGHTFKGWYGDAAFENGPVTEIAAGEIGNKDFWAKWEANTYSVSLNPNSGIMPAGASSSMNYTYGIESVLPVPTRNGYIFIGWSENRDNTSTRGLKKIGADEIGSKTLYANWLAEKDAVTHDLIFNGNGGAFEGEAQRSDYFVEILGADLDEYPVPVRKGYDFSGWYKNENCSGEAVTVIPEGTNEGAEYWAKWTPQTHKIVVILNNGEENGEAEYTVGEGYALSKLTKPEKTGYTFIGWYRDSSLNTEITSVSTEETDDLLIYAGWKANEYSLTLNLNGGYLANKPEVYVYDTALELPKPVRGAYKFDGWYANESLTGEPVELVEAGETGGKAFWAKWTAKPAEELQFSVSYDTDGGKIKNESRYTSYTEGEGLTLPVPQKGLHNFMGWYDNSSFSGSPVTEIGVNETGDKKYWARFELKEGADPSNPTASPLNHTVTLELNGGHLEDESVLQYTEGVGISLPEPVKPRYNFGGWYEDPNFDGEALARIDENEVKNIVLYAEWIEKDPAEYTFKITYHLDGGKIVNSKKYDAYIEGEGIPVLPNAQKGLYEFKGWFDNEEKIGDPVTSIGIYETGAKEFWASFEIKEGIDPSDPETYPTHSLGFNLNGGIFKMPEKTDDENGGGTSGEEGGDENGGNTSGEEGGDENGGNTSGEEGGDENGGNTSGGEGGDNTGDEGNEGEEAEWKIPDFYVEGVGIPELPIPAKVGCDFKGWYRNPEFEGETLTCIDENEIEDIKLYAKWEEIIDSITEIQVIIDTAVDAPQIPEAAKPNVEKSLKYALISDKDWESLISADNKENIVIKLLIQKSDGNPFTKYGDYTAAETYNIVITKNEETIVQTLNPVTITLNIPGGIKKADRTIAVVRTHNGVKTLLTDADDNPDTITFDSDSFSDYTLVYMDTNNQGGNQ
ncbi:MAG: InlB B-repeat-containing protein, partial [Firmicutes bacterium]|nr:InlB B-repeat-containing protein [Bacillota bacterium]